MRLEITFVFRLKLTPLTFIHGNFFGTFVQQHVGFQIALRFRFEIAFATREHLYFVLTFVNVQYMSIQIIFVFRLEWALPAFVHRTFVRRQMHQHVPLQVMLELRFEIARITRVHRYFVRAFVRQHVCFQVTLMPRPKGANVALMQSQLVRVFVYLHVGFEQISLRLRLELALRARIHRQFFGIFVYHFVCIQIFSVSRPKRAFVALIHGNFVGIFVYQHMFVEVIFKFGLKAAVGAFMHRDFPGIFVCEHMRF